jgi:rhamnosyltransferase
MTAPSPHVDVVVRCRNEMPHTARCLRALAAQRGLTARILFLDCGSTDGSREAAIEACARVIDLDPAGYIPGRVLNLGMGETHSPLVAFINADAVACTTDALETLLAPFEADPDVCATFARQVARTSADAQTHADMQRAFGNDALPVRHGSFFSMAAAAVRRSVWSALPFDSDLRYSEDVDWTARAERLGWSVAYVPASRFEHSHDYSLQGHFKRRRGEGVADTTIHRLGSASVVRDLVRPTAGALLRDAHAGVLDAHAALVRISQGVGYFIGRVEGA